MGDNRTLQREFNGCGVHHTNHVPRAWSFQDAEEGTVATIFRVKLYHLLVVVGSLQQLDARVEGTTVGLKKNLYAVNGRIERVRRCADGGRRFADKIVTRLSHQNAFFRFHVQVSQTRKMHVLLLSAVPTFRYVNPLMSGKYTHPSILVQGGSLRTWTFRSPLVERVQVVLHSNGRPLDADIELWA